MLLVGLGTWTLSASIQPCRVIFFLIPYDVQSTGSMGGIKVFAGSGENLLTQIEPRDSASNPLIVDLPERESLIKRKRDVLARFLHVLNPLVEVYKIPQTSLHVFADQEGQLVAFNRGGSLFMNLRYFEAWRTSCVFCVSPNTRS
jgi:hypothetical protein